MLIYSGKQNDYLKESALEEPEISKLSYTYTSYTTVRLAEWRTVILRCQMFETSEGPSRQLILSSVTNRHSKHGDQQYYRNFAQQEKTSSGHVRMDVM